MRKKILVITGTRAEYGYLRPVLKEIKRSKKLDLRLLVTGMHTLKRHGRTINEIKKDNMPIAAVVPVHERDTMLESLAKEIRGIERYCTKERPDIILVIADRDEQFAGAIVAGHLGIPLVHISGGDTTGYVVDEVIRHAITKFAHIHFPSTMESAKRLRMLGEESWRIHPVGSTTFDELRRQTLPSRATIARELSLEEKKKWLLVIQHPTPLDPTPLEEQLAPTLRALQTFDAEVIIIYPNSDTGGAAFIRAIEKLRTSDAHVYRSLPRSTFMALLKHADVLIGNSSAGILEAGYFKTPVVDIGGRQKGRERGVNVLHAPYDEHKIEAAIRRALSSAFARIARKTHHPYDRGNASEKIVRILLRLKINEKLLRKEIRL